MNEPSASTPAVLAKKEGSLSHWLVKKKLKGKSLLLHVKYPERVEVVCPKQGAEWGT